MIELLSEYGLFLAKALTLVVAVLLVAGNLFAMAQSAKDRSPDHLTVRNLNLRLRDLADTINHEILDKAALKALNKSRKAEEKSGKKAKPGQEDSRPRIFVLDFEGDMQAHAADTLRQEVSAVLQVAGEKDEVVVKLESAGGVVHGYGLAASQLTRIRSAKVPLTVVVDKVAASGGYMMACVADRILAAPFAIVGSIGVVAQIPNFNRLLKKNEIDLELHTAGEYKRTLTLFGENTDAAREKFREDLEETHVLFKSFISEYRPDLDIEAVATGEHWFGKRALALNLVDELRTSDDYLLARSKEADIYELKYRQHKTLSDRLGLGMANVTKILRNKLPIGFA